MVIKIELYHQPSSTWSPAEQMQANFCVYVFTFLMAVSVYSQHYITAVAIKPVLLQVEYKVWQQKKRSSIPLASRYKTAICT